VVRLPFDSGPVPINPGIDVMGQTLHFALQEKQQPFSASDHHEAAIDVPNGDLQHLREMTLR
jgi:hypothetical protein